MKKLLLTLCLLASSHALLSQCPPDLLGGPIHSTGGIIDGVVLQEHVPTKKLIGYEYVREADMIWSKRTWRTIDLREKINHPLYYPTDAYDPSGNWVLNTSRWSLYSIIRAHVLNGDLKVFSPYNPYSFTMHDGDQFKYPIIPEPGKNYCTDSIFRDKLFYYLGSLGPESDKPLVDQFGEDSMNRERTRYIYPDRDTLWYLSSDIVQYRLKEDWFFDKERSVLDVRILGIAPVRYNKTPGGQITGLEEMFWLYFPHCRFVFNNYFAYNPKNDAQWMSFDDLFWKRQFSSTIYKNSNTFDRNIESYRTGVDALMESEKITEEIRTLEHDVWHF
jgi:gliding motility associated protien GldN